MAEHFQVSRPTIYDVLKRTRLQEFTPRNWGGGLWNDRPDAGIAYIVKYSAPVPEPEIYAMLLAGLGIIGFAGRRLRNS